MIRHDLEIIHVHIHRCAGTAVEHFFNCPYRYDHRSPKHFIDQFGEDTWKDYFTFAFIRNPWAKMLSHYMWRQQQAWWYAKGDELEFKEWVKNFDQLTEGENSLQDENVSQVQWLFEDDEPVVDYIAKVEELDKEWPKICEEIGIEYKPLPRLNTTTHKYYSEYYDDETKEIVGERYQRDIRKFGYEFEDRKAKKDQKAKERLEALGYID